MDLTFRPLLPDDASWVAMTLEAVHAQAKVPLGPQWTTQQVHEECQERGFIAEDRQSGRVAFVLFRDVREAWEISFLATEVNACGCGVMLSLLQHLLLQLPADKALWLEVHEANNPARQLYRKLGWVERGRRPGYYRDGGAAILYNDR